ncbi:MAG: protein kinase [Thermoanaerobaculia bacterium]|nr:protein kinase [Thermoanaerobaculia bacterium]
MSLPPGTVLGRYRILRRLGAGAMGEVYLAEDPQIERKLALKTVRILSRQTVDTEELEARLLREAKAAGRLVHSHVVTLFDAGEAEGLFYLAFEYVDGPDLSQRMKSPPPLTLGQILRIGRQAAEGLQAAHRREIVHRDIKPSNLLLDSEDRIKISDFGIAKMVGQKTELTQTGSVIGSPHYLSPEQVRGEELDGRSDLFSLGVVLYELLTRRRPFEGDTITTLVYQILSRDPTPIGEVVPDLPVEVQEIVDRLLEKDREDRFESAAQLARALRRCEESIPAEILAAPPAPSREAEETRVLEEEAGGAGTGEAEKGATAPTVVQAPPGPKAPVPPEAPPPPPDAGAEGGSGETPGAVPPPPPPEPSVSPQAPERRRESDVASAGPPSRRGLLVGLLLTLTLAIAVGAWWLVRSRSASAPPEVHGESPEMAVAEITDGPDLSEEDGAGSVPAEKTEPREGESAKPPSGTSDEGTGTGLAPESGLPEDVENAPDRARTTEAPEDESLEEVATREPDPASPEPEPVEIRQSPEPRESEPEPDTGGISREAGDLETRRPPAEPETAETRPRESRPEPEDLLEKLRSRVDRELTTGLGLVFDVEPEDTFVLLRGRGDRRFVTLGQASEWSGGRDGRIYTLPGPGDYLLRFRDAASRNKLLLIHARPGAGPTTISVNMNALSGERVDRGDLTRYRVGEGITLDVDPRRAARRAFVVVNGERRGGAREFSGRGSALRLSAGDHRVAVIAPGFRRVDFLVEVRPGHDERFEEVELEMEPDR